MKNEVQIYTTNVEITSENVKELNELNTAYTNVTRRIKRSMENIFSNFLDIAALLHEAKQKDIYTWVGYKDIYDYAYNEFDLGKTTVKNYIQIASKCLESDNDEPYLRKGNLLEQYKHYNYSQLVELLNVPELDLEKYNPEMSVREIKENRFKENFKTYIKNMIDLSNEDSDIRKFIKDLENTLLDKYPNEKLNYKDITKDKGYGGEELSLILRFELNKDEYLFELKVHTYYDNQLNITIWGSSYRSYRNLDDALVEAKDQLIKQAIARICERIETSGQTSDQVDGSSEDDIVGQTSDQEIEAVEVKAFRTGKYVDFLEDSDFEIEAISDIEEIFENFFSNYDFEWYPDNYDVKIIMDDEHYLFLNYAMNEIRDLCIEIKNLKTNELVKEYTISDLFKFILENKIYAK